MLLIDKEILYLISPDIANYYRVIPYRQAEGTIEIFVDKNNHTEEVKDEIELLLGNRVVLVPQEPSEIDKLLSVHYRRERIKNDVKAFSTTGKDFLEELLYEARSLKSSDIHFEVYETDARIRFRIDGQLIERYKIEQDNYLELVNKIKIKSKLNITEKRLPQDGRIMTKDFDIRVSVLPTLFGEKIVMRLLGQDASNIDLKTLGFKEDELRHYLEAVKKPNGIILISGPTGSGKTTTLYATLKLLNDSKRNIVTVEDPIEYTLKGINQVQLRDDIGLTFAAAIKSFLRQDPDIIMLGEIRDPETALMAIRASLTGHLVLSTIHTNSAIGTISRLIDMGVPAYLIAETLNVSLAQRLVRKLCPHCKTQTVFNANDFPVSFTIPYVPDTLYKASGCANCYYTGYKGRVAIYELFFINHEVSNHIKNNDLQELNKKKDYKPLAAQGFDILCAGDTSLDEVYSILLNV
ncbi:GspE/PulE family protein [Flavobacterium sp. RNTU_13]|uniref:GspE/PulE family protein n=1 Tax=Flavobacterium sp. RNTU_13 TaxID=3375145 RepID=UPI0039862448